MGTMQIAQDFGDCVAGEYGEWWKTRADEFIEEYQDSDPNLAWHVWAQIRRDGTPEST